MQPSSLVFLILIVIWAAYLLQHWVRRREHLAMARSVDRFSDAMRVLERRPALPELDLSAPRSRPRSYAVSPARPSRQEVVVKRAKSQAPNVRETPATGVRPTRIFHFLAGVSARRLRGLSLLVALSLVVVVVTLAAFSVAPWWSIPLAFAILVADVAWLREVAVSQRAGRAVQEDGSAEGDSEFEFDFAPEREPEVPASESVAVSESKAPESAAEAETTRPAQTPQPSEPAAVAETAQPAEPSAEADPAGWAPVPVPPPTYTLKAKAEPPYVWSEPDEVEESSSAQPLTLDCLVYDYDLDELVERRSATGT